MVTAACIKTVRVIDVKHTVIECVGLTDVRNKYSVASLMKELFENPPGTGIRGLMRGMATLPKVTRSY